MTPARRAALQWFHDRGEVAWVDRAAMGPSHISYFVFKRMQTDGLLDGRDPGCGGPFLYSLTDKGRRMLNGDAMTDPLIITNASAFAAAVFVACFCAAALWDISTEGWGE
jgi:hypothetical protein